MGRTLLPLIENYFFKTSFYPDYAAYTGSIVMLFATSGVTTSFMTCPSPSQVNQTHPVFQLLKDQVSRHSGWVSADDLC